MARGSGPSVSADFAILLYDPYRAGQKLLYHGAKRRDVLVDIRNHKAACAEAIFHLGRQAQKE